MGTLEVSIILILPLDLCYIIAVDLTTHLRVVVPADEGSTAGFLFKGVALGCGDGEVLTTIGGSPSQRIAMPYSQRRWN